MKYGNITFPPGTKGNHLRWLLFLDQRIHNPYTDDQSIDGKIQFIKKEIYNETRTWNNWMDVEWEFKPKLNDQLEIKHNLNEFPWDWETNPFITKELFLKVDDPKLLLNHYFHINLGLNSSTPKKFLYITKTFLDEIKVIENNIGNLKNIKVLDATWINEPTLNKNGYSEVINFFEFDDNYEVANQIHIIYNSLLKRSARDFYDYITSSDEFKQYLETMRILGYN